jgi:hypothetical protein
MATKDEELKKIEEGQKMTIEEEATELLENSDSISGGRKEEEHAWCDTSCFLACSSGHTI